VRGVASHERGGLRSASGDVAFTNGVCAAGDADGDGVVGRKDVERMFDFLFLGGLPPEPGAADVNGDGAVSGDDLFQLVSGLWGAAAR
jgi:hypothetical protein